jgi:hypothetical protein
MAIIAWQEAALFPWHRTPSSLVVIAVSGKQGRSYCPLALGSGESYGPGAFASANLSGASFGVGQQPAVAGNDCLP